jgi:hypothetical protein
VEPLLVILLIYAKSIDPQTTHSMVVSKTLQSNFQVLCDMPIRGFESDGSKIIWAPPGIRDSLVIYVLRKRYCHQITNDRLSLDPGMKF